MRERVAQFEEIQKLPHGHSIRSRGPRIESSPVSEYKSQQNRTYDQIYLSMATINSRTVEIQNHCHF